MSTARERKIEKLHRIRIQLSEACRSDALSRSERSALARATDALSAALDAMPALSNKEG